MVPLTISYSRKYFEIRVATIKLRVNLESSKELKPNTTMSNNVTNIRTTAGELRIWESRPGKFAWATPNGSEGSDEASFEDAVKEAFDAEDLNAADYGY